MMGFAPISRHKNWEEAVKAKQEYIKKYEPWTEIFIFYAPEIDEEYPYSVEEE